MVSIIITLDALLESDPLGTAAGLSHQLTPLPLSRADAGSQNVLHEDDQSIPVAGSSPISYSSSLWKGHVASPRSWGRRRCRRFEFPVLCGASAIKCWWLPRNPLVCWSLSLISRDAVLWAMRAGLTTRCLTFRDTFVCTPTSLLMAFADTGRPTDTSIQIRRSNT